MGVNNIFGEAVLRPLVARPGGQLYCPSVPPSYATVVQASGADDSSESGGGRHWQTGNGVVLPQNLSTRLPQNVVASGIDEWIDGEVDETERDERIEPLH